MNGRLFFLAIAAFMGTFLSLTAQPLILLLFIVYLYFLSKNKNVPSMQLVIFGCIFLAFSLSGHFATKHNTTKIPEQTVSFLLEVTGDPKFDGDMLQVPVIERNRQEQLLLRYQLKSQQEKMILTQQDFYGLQCQIGGTLKKPSIAKNPNGFNYRAYLKVHKIYWLVESEQNPFQNCAPIKKSPLTSINELRFKGIKKVEADFPLEIAALSNALIFGDRNLLTPDLLEDYQKTGIVHLLAISGLHVSLLVGMIFYLGIRFGLTRQFMTSFLLMILPIYIVLTGSSPSVIRSVLMIYLVLLSIRWKTKWKVTPLDAISLAWMVFLFVSPLTIYDVGFQLSFTVSFAIILSASYILKRYQNNLARMLITSLIAQFAALPLLLYHFFEISFISIIANLLFIPLFSFIFLPGLYCLFFIDLIGGVPTWLIGIFLKIIHLSDALIQKLSGIPFSHFTPGRPNGIMLLIYIMVIVILFCRWEANRKIILVGVFLFTFQPVCSFLNPYGEITMIDVGQGDSTLIHLPFGKGNYLIDTGGIVSFGHEPWKEKRKPFETGRDIVVPFLKGKGITAIDKLILTHGDMDHIGGSFALLDDLKVKEILMPSVTQPSAAELQIIQEAKEKGIRVSKLSEGNGWKNSVASFYVLSPEKNFTGERNRGSIALFAKVGGSSWFFGGDLDQEGEKEILRKYPHLKVDVLKAGHHGSKTSSAEEFVRAITPKVALISCGEHNRFGHPHKVVLDLLEKNHTRIFRTDQQGAVTYKFYKGNGTFLPFLP